MTDPGFTVVTRKKWLSRKSLNKKQLISKNAPETALPEVDVPKFLNRLQRVREHMVSSDYFHSFLTILNESLQHLEDDKILKLVCFGIGPFTRCIQALHQFAFILELQKHLQVNESIYYDPVFQNSEKEVLKSLNCSLMNENCEAKYPTECITLYYLPHCPNSLTNNLLWKNWMPEMLGKTILINNSFESLSCNKPERLLRLDSGYILDVLPYTKEFVIEDCYETHNVFNDLSVHVFPMSTLPIKSSEFWTYKEAPVYEETEMITTNMFTQLALS